MNKDLIFGIVVVFFFVFLVIFIVTTGEPTQNADPFPIGFGFFGFGGGFSFFSIILGIGMIGAIVFALLGRRRRRPDDFQSMDQLYWQSKQNKPEQFTGNDEDESKKFEEK